MGFAPLSFGFPLALAGLVALPVIWWLLRLTPPRPQTEIFPPLRILARVLRREETPFRSPWWLTLLRLLIAGLVVLALAEPVLNPSEAAPVGGGPLAVVMDNDWAAAPDWPNRVATAARLIGDAANSGAPVLLALTSEKPNAEIGPFNAKQALDRLRAAKPRPIPPDRPATYARLAGALTGLPGATVAVLSDGLAADGDDAALKALLLDRARLVWVAPDRLALTGLTATDNAVDAFTVTAIRATGDVAPRTVTAGAFDERGRRIGDAAIRFGAGETVAIGKITAPFELRNDFSSVSIDGEPQAAALRVLDENAKRRRVGLIAEGAADQAQPLLSPLYYIRRALQPFADLIEPSTQDLAQAIPELLDRKPAMIVMADVGTLPATARARLLDWVKGGGTLVRFAGSRLAAAGNDDDLLPVSLRIGERSLGGALSWTEPQKVAEFSPGGPFADLPPPRDVSVTRQILAEPTADLARHTWASLADGTPLVTGATRDKGTVVLFHVTPEATWSNLPISGSFVDMLRRVVQLSRNQGLIDAKPGQTAPALPPFRMIDAAGQLSPPDPDARPLESGAGPKVTIENPPGLYGNESGVVAHNLLAGDARLAPIVRPQTSLPVTAMRYAADRSQALKGPLIALALLLMALDTLAVFWIGGAFARRRRSGGAPAVAATLALMLLVPLLHASPALADDARAGDAAAVDAVSRTHIAYVITGESAVDDISKAGIKGLNQFLVDKTALEPGEPAGVDIAKDELSFYPLIYWPIDPGAAMPSEDAIGRVDAYMKGGGTVLFDTRDQFSTDLIGSGAASPATERLRDILANLNVPPLEPVPDDHVLTKSFFILRDFPGRFAGSPLWIEASTEPVGSADNRPVRSGDGVSPIMITGNDLAGAWAVDDSGQPLLPTVPGDPMQRVYALRAGVNIMMYMLTGNYKSDQVHVPVLLERLGQ